MARYSDPQLLAILRKAARRINRRMNLTNTSEEITVLTDGSITPDDDDLKDLVLLQAECLIASREFQDDLGSGSVGVAITDGEQSVDTRQASVARGTFFDSPHSPCSELDKAIMLELMKRTGGRMVW